MKFKYYLKGLGMGIVFATIILTVSSMVHKDELSDQEIIDKAMELGMIMPESQDVESTSKTDAPTESDTTTELDIVTEVTSETEPETTSDSETISQPESTSEQETTSEPESTSESQSQGPIHVEITQYVLHIAYGDTPRMIATELYENGVIDDAAAFREYLSDNGYAKKLRSGSYTITVGMTYEEIAQLITKS